MSNLPHYAIVLAAGKGTRMQSSTQPKVLFPIANRPMLAHVLDYLQQAGLANDQIVIVVGFLAEMVEERFALGYHFVRQTELLGTADSAKRAEPILADKGEGVTVIVNGDQPFFRPSSIQRLTQAIENGATMAVLTGDMADPEFDGFGRVITDSEGCVQKIVEVKDATEEQRAIRLMNLGGYACNNQWLWSALNKIEKSPVTGEYYITDLIDLAVSEGKKAVAIQIEDRAEALGINTLEHLAAAEAIAKQSSR